MSERKIWGPSSATAGTNTEITVADDGAMRTLYFGDGIMQSTIRPCQPGRLVEELQPGDDERSAVQE
jgi:hypothetical protein